MRRPRLYLLASLLALGLWALTGCNPRASYTNKGVTIGVQVDSASVTSASLYVDIRPERDTYYYCGIIADTSFQYEGLDYRFMQYMLDSVYADYLMWRRKLLAASAPYVATFASHSLCYGNDRRLFTNLSAGTEYVVYAFCVNPNTNTPTGKLYYDHVTTAAKSMSSLTFNYSIEHKQDGLWLTIEPSNDTEPYVVDILSEEQLANFDSTPEGYLRWMMKLFSEADLPSSVNIQQRGYYSVNLDSEATGVTLLPGTKIYIILAGYDGDFTTAVQHAVVTYRDDMDDIQPAQFQAEAPDGNP